MLGVVGRKRLDNAASDASRAQSRARGAVRKAVLDERLLPVNTLLCVDCGQPAREYDHYLGYADEHVLDVQPTCRGCNLRRKQPPEIRAKRPSCGTCGAGSVYVTQNGSIRCRRCGETTSPGGGGYKCVGSKERVTSPYKRVVASSNLVGD